MGLGHCFDEFLAAAHRSETRGLVWVFAGGGSRRDEVARFIAVHPHLRVELLPYAPSDRLAISLAAADVHLVSLRSPWAGLVVPSKLQAAFAAGRPVIFVGPRDSEPADWTMESGGGWVVPEGDVDALREALAEASDAAERTRRGGAAREFARRHFDRTRNTKRIAELLETTAVR
jgi:glycosyltransferase involved in cell wall biosynthesis